MPRAAPADCRSLGASCLGHSPQQQRVLVESEDYMMAWVKELLDSREPGTM